MTRGLLFMIVIDLPIIYNLTYTVELQRLKHLWDHEN